MRYSFPALNLPFTTLFYPRILLKSQKMVGIDFLNLFDKAALLLGGSAVKVSHEGWPRDRWDGCRVANILPNPEPTFFYIFNKLAYPAHSISA